MATRFFYNYLKVAVWLFLAGFLPAQGVAPVEVAPANQAPAAASGAASPAKIVSNETHVIEAGDKLSYRVIEDREAPKSLLVSAAGEIEVPYLGRSLVAGKTVNQAARYLKMLLEKDLYYQATVVLSVEELALKPVVPVVPVKPKQVVVVGQVRVQGVQEMPVGERYTVSRAILKAGGFSSFANGRKVQVARKTKDGKTDRVTVDVMAVLKDGRVENDVELQADDMVIVPEKMVNF
ncbi:MAG: polysaccharide biosynthesis/export family protein [Verrucomicrobiae bacterium]|nr:polysaccharide biosynthesis/export family protein [Verrucomicrobiae bacterium]